VQTNKGNQQRRQHHEKDNGNGEETQGDLIPDIEKQKKAHIQYEEKTG